jgi:hypothetical protein
MERVLNIKLICILELDLVGKSKIQSRKELNTACGFM